MSPADMEGALAVLPVWVNVSLYGTTSLVIHVSEDGESSTLIQEDGSLVLNLSEADLFALTYRRPAPAS